jgi:hypothetical protein
MGSLGEVGWGEPTLSVNRRTPGKIERRRGWRREIIR